MRAANAPEPWTLAFARNERWRIRRIERAKSDRLDAARIIAGMNASIATAAPLSLWKEMCALVHQLFGLFGEPQEIASRQLLGRDEHAAISKWLRGAECFLRQLLLIEASALPTPAPCLASSSKPRASRASDAPRRHDLARPETWRVSFCVFSSPTRGGGDREAIAGAGAAFESNIATPFVSRCAGDTSPAGGGRNQPFRSAWPLALRAEALLRAYNDPLPFARRLAARLRREPRRADSITRAAANPHAHHGVVRFEAMAELWTCSSEKAPAFRHADSS